MPDTLREQLQRSVHADAHPPVDAIMARGDRLTRRRRVLATALVVGAVGAASVTGLVALSGGRSGTAKLVQTPASEPPPACPAPVTRDSSWSSITVTTTTRSAGASSDNPADSACRARSDPSVARTTVPVMAGSLPRRPGLIRTRSSRVGGHERAQWLRGRLAPWRGIG